MPESDVVQISVGGHRTGIIGLKSVLEQVAKEFAGRPDADIKTELMKRLGKSNYIVPSARAAYEAAFLREYKKLVGEPIPDDPSGAIQIKVLGPGCPSCDKLEQDLMAVMAELNLPAALDHVRDVKEIACYGVMGNQALVINGKVVAVGRVPSKNQLKEWLKAASKNNEKERNMDIKVLGPGCAKCQQTEKIVKEAVAEAGITASVEKVTDVMKIAEYGVFGTPAVVVDGDVKCVGKIPTKEDVKKWVAQ